MAGWSPGYGYCHQAYGDGETVSEHVPCIAYQSDTPGEDPANDLDDHHDPSDGQRQSKPSRGDGTVLKQMLGESALSCSSFHLSRRQR